MKASAKDASQSPRAARLKVSVSALYQSARSARYRAHRDLRQVTPHAAGLAKNETPGTWEVQVRELASGIESVKWMKVRRE